MYNVCAWGGVVCAWGDMCDAVHCCAGKGLMMVYSALQGQYTSLAAECIAAKQSLKRFSDDYKIEGFVQAVATPNILDGLTHA